MNTARKDSAGELSAKQTNDNVDENVSDQQPNTVQKFPTRSKSFPEWHKKRKEVNIVEKLVKGLPGFVGKQSDKGFLFSLYRHRAFWKRY